MKRDKLIFKLLDEEQQRQEEGIELIASENFVSRQVMEAAGSVAERWARRPFRRAA